MKIIEKNNNVSIDMNDGDILEISCLNGNREKIKLECIDSKLYVNKISLKDIDSKYMEEQEIKKMKELLHEKD
jgi:ABC-type phosphonate transport system ATPase subunit